ncbi:MAG: flagellar motor switch protein FliG, partial [Pseudomonadales bacterium]|nr:flagellar motor switch protein FliG [Pseudomonadales bacterium]
MAEAALAQEPRLSGTTRAAILLLVLGEDQAAEVLRHMGPDEVQQVGHAMAELSTVPREQVDTVLGSFLEDVGENTPLGVGSEDYLRRMFVGALGDRRGTVLANRILMGDRSRGLDALRWMDPPAIAQVLRGEHPQIIAIVLAHLDPGPAGKVVSLLPPAIRSEVLHRVANLDSVPPSALSELDDLMDRQFSADPDIERAHLDGLRTAASIINNLGGGMDDEIMADLRERDSELSERIDETMFVFENLLDLDDRMIAAIDTLKRDGATLVFMQST